MGTRDSLVVIRCLLGRHVRHGGHRKFPDRLLVFLRHLPTVLSNLSGRILVDLGHFSEDLYKGWDADFRMVLARFNAQQGRLLVDVQESLDHEVLSFVDEALAEFLQLDKARSSLIEHLDVLSSRKLALFLDSLLVLVLAYLVSVDVGIVLANLPDESFCGGFGTLQECLFSLEHLFLDVLGCIDVKHAGHCHEEELLMVSSWGWKSNGLEYGVDTSVNLSCKAVPFCVINNSELGVTNPRVDEILIKCFSLWDTLVSSFVVGITVELFGAFSGCDHVDYSFVAAVTQLDCTPMSLVEEGLPDLFRSVRFTIHHTTIT